MHDVINTWLGLAAAFYFFGEYPAIDALLWPAILYKRARQLLRDK